MVDYPLLIEDAPGPIPPLEIRRAFINYLRGSIEPPVPDPDWLDEPDTGEDE